MIELKKINKIFHTKDGEVQAVKDVNLSIEKGEIFGVIGFSGAGKSTLIRMLNMLETPTEGSVNINDKKMTKLKGKSLRIARQDIGMIFQHFNILWSRTVEENIGFPLEIAGIPMAKRKKRVNELIQLVGLEGRGKSYPSQLSGGQKQRVGIARALANNPSVLLCDEATSALDPKTTDSILDLLVDINKKLGITIVLITHEMHVIRKICHRVAVMEGGQVVEQGKVLDVFKNPQKQITQEFVKQVTEQQEDLGSVESFIKESPNSQFIHLKFVGSVTGQPLISKLARSFDLDINIIQGKVSQTQDGAYGSLLIQIDSNEGTINQVTDYISQHEVEAEVLNND